MCPKHLGSIDVRLKNVWFQKMLGSKNLGSKIYGSKRILGPNLFFGLNFILVKTKFDWIECGSNCFLGQNILWVEIFLGQNKILGTKTFQFHSCIVSEEKLRPENI